MLVYKATGADMSCHMGHGTFPYQIGVPAFAEESKCGNTGLHACEYVLDCMRYYGIGNGNRFFAASAEGDIAEDGTDTRIACTKLTLIRELDNRDIAKAAISYMVRHPKRNGWDRHDSMMDVGKDSAQINKPGGIAIARGKEPRVKGCKGAYLGFVREQEGKITEAWLLTVEGGIKPDTWYTIEYAKRDLEKGERR